MGLLFITELRDLGFDPRGNSVMAPHMPALAEQRVAIGGASVQSAAFSATTRYVMVNCDATCCLAWGSDPTAAVAAQRMSANETRFYGVNAGDRLAVISST